MRSAAIWSTFSLGVILSSIGFVDGKTILGNDAFKKATRAALEAEHELESLTLALGGGANAQLERYDAEQEAQGKRDFVTRLTGLCQQREAIASNVEKTMRDLAATLAECAEVSAEIAKMRPAYSGLAKLTDPLDNVEFRLNLVAGFIGLDKLGFGEPVNSFGFHKPEPFAEMEARVHRQIIEGVRSTLSLP